MERLRRLYAAAEALAVGRGGISKVARRTGVSRRAISLGIEELESGQAEPMDLSTTCVRKPGGGRKRTVEQDKTLIRDLEFLIDPVTRGDPEPPLRWTCKSLRKLSAELENKGHEVTH